MVCRRISTDAQSLGLDPGCGHATRSSRSASLADHPLPGRSAGPTRRLSVIVCRQSPHVEPMKPKHLITAALTAGLVVTAALASTAVPALLHGATLSTARAGHQATLVPDGRVLVTGGCAGPGCSDVQRSSELYEPDQSRFAAAAAMRDARVSHTASALPDGRVIVAGGWTGAGATASTEIYEPPTGRFLPGPTMSVARMDATATVLDTGDVLLLGGTTATNRPTPVVDRFSPATGQMTAAAPLRVARAHHASVKLRDGRVLVVGGLVGPHTATASAEIYDPASDTFRPVGELGQPRCKHAALLLADGRVLVLAGSGDCNNRRRLASTEIFDPTTETFLPGPGLVDPRYKVASAAVRLHNGAVMIAGDASDIEVWKPGTANFVRVEGRTGPALAFSSATTLRSGRVLVVGGYDATITPTARAWEVNLPQRELR